MQGGRQLLPTAGMSQGGPWQSRSFGVRRLSGHEPNAMGSMAGFRRPNLDPAWSGSALSAIAICQPAVGGGWPRGKRPCPLDPWPLVYADCREGPELRGSLHRPGATRHPWRDAPFCGHPDRAPATLTLPSARQTASGHMCKSKEQQRRGPPSGR
jgi:hypothetical protein